MQPTTRTECNQLPALGVARVVLHVHPVCRHDADPLRRFAEVCHVDASRSRRAQYRPGLVYGLPVGVGCNGSCFGYFDSLYGRRSDGARLFPSLPEPLAVLSVEMFRHLVAADPAQYGIYGQDRLRHLPYRVGYERHVADRQPDVPLHAGRGRCGGLCGGVLSVSCCLLHQQCRRAVGAADYQLQLRRTSDREDSDGTETVVANGSGGRTVHLFRTDCRSPENRVAISGFA